MNPHLLPSRRQTSACFSRPLFLLPRGGPTALPFALRPQARQDDLPPQERLLLRFLRHRPCSARELYRLLRHYHARASRESSPPLLLEILARWTREGRAVPAGDFFNRLALDHGPRRRGVLVYPAEGKFFLLDRPTRARGTFPECLQVPLPRIADFPAPPLPTPSPPTPSRRPGSRASPTSPAGTWPLTVILPTTGAPELLSPLAAGLRRIPVARVVAVFSHAAPEGMALAHQEGWTVLRAPPPFVYSRSVNLGIAPVTTPFFLLLNDDVPLPPGSDRKISRLLEIMRRFPHAGTVGPRGPRYGDFVASGRRLPGTPLIDCRFPLHAWCLLVRTRAHREAGPFDENFVFWGGEEIDWGWRIRQARWKSYLHREVKMRHRAHVSFRRLGLPIREFQNHAYFWHKHGFSPLPRDPAWRAFGGPEISLCFPDPPRRRRLLGPLLTTLRQELRTRLLPGQWEFVIASPGKGSGGKDREIPSLTRGDTVRLQVPCSSRASAKGLDASLGRAARARATGKLVTLLDPRQPGPPSWMGALEPFPPALRRNLAPWTSKPGKDGRKSPGETFIPGEELSRIAWTRSRKPS